MKNSDIKNRIGIFLLGKILIFLVLFRKPYFLRKKYSRLELATHYGLIGLSTLFLFDIISIEVLSTTIYFSLICFVIAIPLIAIGILTIETGFSISNKIAVPIFVYIISTFGDIFAIIGISLLIFNKSIMAGFIFITLVTLSIFFLVFAFPNFILLNFEKISKIKDKDVLETFNIPGLYFFDKFFSIIDDWIKLNQEGFIDIWELFTVVQYFGSPADQLLRDCCVLKREDQITDTEFRDFKRFIFHNYRRTDKLEEITSSISEKMKNLKSTSENQTILKI